MSGAGERCQTCGSDDPNTCKLSHHHHPWTVVPRTVGRKYCCPDSFHAPPEPPLGDELGECPTCHATHRLARTIIQTEGGPWVCPDEWHGDAPSPLADSAPDQPQEARAEAPLCGECGQGNDLPLAVPCSNPFHTPTPPDQEARAEQCECGGEWLDCCDGECEWTECADCESVKPRTPTPPDQEARAERCPTCGSVDPSVSPTLYVDDEGRPTRDKEAGRGIVIHGAYCCPDPFHHCNRERSRCGDQREEWRQRALDAEGERDELRETINQLRPYAMAQIEQNAAQHVAAMTQEPVEAELAAERKAREQAERRDDESRAAEMEAAEVADRATRRAEQAEADFRAQNREVDRLSDLLKAAQAKLTHREVQLREHVKWCEASARSGAGCPGTAVVGPAMAVAYRLAADHARSILEGSGDE